MPLLLPPHLVCAAGRLDYCTDSWALGLLVLSLRKGQQPFWWVKQQGKLPSGETGRGNRSGDGSHQPAATCKQDMLTQLQCGWP